MRDKKLRDEIIAAERVSPRLRDELLAERMVEQQERRVISNKRLRQETKAVGKQKHRIQERHKPRDWPLDAETGKRADIEPEDVMASPPEDPVKLEDLRAIAASGVDMPRDDSLDARRRADHDREMARRRKLQGPTWTVEMVDERLTEAFKTLARSTGGVGPRAFGNAMPTPVREMSDIVSQLNNKSLRKAVGRLLRGQGPPSTDEMKRMQDALSWALRYLKEEPDLAAYVNLGGMWRAWGAKVKHKCEEMGVHRQVFYRDRKAALELIVAGLRRDGRAP